MKSVNSVWVVLLILLALFVGGWRNQSPTEKWEYKVGNVEDYTSLDAFNKLGQEGWELVSVEGTVGFFKRRK